MSSTIHKERILFSLYTVIFANQKIVTQFFCPLRKIAKFEFLIFFIVFQLRTSKGREMWWFSLVISPPQCHEFSVEWFSNCVNCSIQAIKCKLVRRSAQCGKTQFLAYKKQVLNFCQTLIFTPPKDWILFCLILFYDISIFAPKTMIFPSNCKTRKI